MQIVVRIVIKTMKNEKDQQPASQWCHADNKSPHKVLKGGQLPPKATIMLFVGVTITICAILIVIAFFLKIRQPLVKQTCRCVQGGEGR